MFAWIQISHIFSKYLIKNLLAVKDLLMPTRFLCTGVTFASFSERGNMDRAIKLFRLVKAKSAKKPELLLVQLVWISDSWVALFT